MSSVRLYFHSEVHTSWTGRQAYQLTVLRLGYYYPGGNRSALLHLLTTALEVRGALRALLFLLPTGVLKRSASCATLSFRFC
eukprot:scaffold592_cov272-Chaetoceros_neogracile.AAC.15